MASNQGEEIKSHNAELIPENESLQSLIICTERAAKEVLPIEFGKAHTDELAATWLNTVTLVGTNLSCCFQAASLLGGIFTIERVPIKIEFHVKSQGSVSFPFSVMC